MARQQGDCYKCRFLCQTGDGMCVCLRYDPYEEGGTILDDIPEPLYDDCFTPMEASQ